jgi:hypothetical protein
VAETLAAPQMRKPTQRNVTGICWYGAKTKNAIDSVDATCSAVSTRPAGAWRHGPSSTIGAMTRIADRWDGSTALNAAHGSSSMNTQTTSDAMPAVTVAAKKAARQNWA